MKDSDKFFNRLSKDLKKSFTEFEFELDGEMCKICNEESCISIDLNETYRSYINKRKTYKEILKHIVSTVDKIINNKKEGIDYNSIYPILKHKDFNLDNGDNILLRKRLFLDIDMVFVVDLDGMFQVITLDHNLDFDKVYKNAWENIDKIENEIANANEIEIYSLKFPCDYAGSMLFNKKIESEIIKKIGVNYIFVISSSSWVFIAKNVPEYIPILKELIAIDEDPNKVSDRVYGYINGEYCYMD